MQLITIGWFTEPWEAYIARGRLEVEGIRAYIVHEHHVWAKWMLATALGHVKLQVLARDAEAGTTVLKHHFSGVFEKDLEAEFGMLPRAQCPRCSGEAIQKRVSKGALFTAVACYALFGVVYPPTKDRAVCEQCSYRWRVK